MKTLLDPKPFLTDIAHTKIRQFAAEASANEISDMRNSTNKPRRYTLLLCLLHETQARTRDDMVEMFLRRMKKTENAAKDKLSVIQQGHRTIEENLMAAFADVLRHARHETTMNALGERYDIYLMRRAGLKICSFTMRLSPSITRTIICR